MLAQVGYISPICKIRPSSGFGPASTQPIHRRRQARFPSALGKFLRARRERLRPEDLQPLRPPQHADLKLPILAPAQG
jgi:hypothetical protein